MDVVALEYRAVQIRLIRVSTLKPFKRSLFIAKGFEEGIGESIRVKWRCRERGNGFFDFYCIHTDTTFILKDRIRAA